MKKRILTLMMALVIAFSAVTPAFAGKNPDPACGGNIDRDVKPQEIGAQQNNTRKNASGPKITSNAHSADFPGIYFVWDSKQKDSGYLLVEDWVFEQNESFTLTSKESNTYWDFVIKEEDGIKQKINDCYAFIIPRAQNNKNINMVFVSEFIDKCSAESKTYTVGFYAYNNGNKPILKFSLEIPKGEAIDWVHNKEIQDLWNQGEAAFNIEERWNGSREWNKSWGIDYDTQVHTGDWLIYNAKTGTIGEQYIERGEWMDDKEAVTTFNCVDIIPEVRNWVEEGIIRYYAICQLWNDLVWGNDGYGLTEVYSLSADIIGDKSENDLSYGLFPTGIDHRTALMKYWNTTDKNVRYVPFGNVNEDGLKFDYEEWADYILTNEYNGVSLQGVLIDLDIDVEDFIANYDTIGFITRNNLWEE